MAARGRPRKFDRDEALERAMDLFWDRGYEATGMAELVEKMGIGRQSIYNTFGDKKALFVGALEHYQQKVTQCVLDSMSGPGSGLENIRGWIQSWVGFAEDAQCRGCMMVNTLAEFGNGDEDVARVLRHAFGRHEEAIFEALERARIDGELRGDADTRSLARGLATMGQGVALMGRIGVSRETLDGVVKTGLSIVDNARPETGGAQPE